MRNRLIKKYFMCDRCKELESQMIHPNQFSIKCSRCGAFLNEIPENEYIILQKNTKNKNEEIKMNNDSPYMPSERVFQNISSVYERPPSNSRHNYDENNENPNRYSNINNNRRRNRRRHQSTNHYSDMNIVNDNIYNNDNYNNINNNNINNYNEINENTEDNDFGEQEERSNQRRSRFWNGARNRGRSTDPMNISFSDNFFNNFFESPMIPFNMMMSPFMFSHNEEEPFRVFVQRQTVPEFIFDPMFLSFGSMFNDNFRNNFSSNFRSNFRGNFLNEIIRILERNEDEAARRAHPPTSESALNKLKRFPLSEKYCKKDKNGKIELPSCCICLNDIEKNEETVLLPCGHMFHWNCCLNWLKRNNTCPMCRFVIKD